VIGRAVVQALFVVQDKISLVSLDGRGPDELLAVLHGYLPTCNTGPHLGRVGAAF
jgi:hypothetical protein